MHAVAVFSGRCTATKIVIVEQNSEVKYKSGNTHQQRLTAVIFCFAALIQGIIKVPFSAAIDPYHKCCRHAAGHGGYVAVLSDDVMRTSLLLLLLVAVRAVVGASNRSLLPNDTELVATCVPSILDGVLLSPHNMPDWMLKLKQVAEEAARGVARGAFEEELLRRKLKEHPEIRAIAVSLSRPPGHAVVIYRTGDESVLVHQLTNLSSLVDTTWRSVLDTSWNQSYKASDNSEGWTPPFLDCLTAKWLFGYSVSFHRYSTTGKYSKSSDTGA